MKLKNFLKGAVICVLFLLAGNMTVFAAEDTKDETAASECQSNLQVQTSEYSGRKEVWITDDRTGQEVVGIIVDFQYGYSDGLWAEIYSAEVTTLRVSGYIVGQPYDYVRMNDSNGAILKFKLNISDGTYLYRYNICISCDLYGELDIGANKSVSIIL